MEQKMNQAVLFTKPVRHLALPLTSEELDEKARRYFEAKGFNFILSKRVTGSELAERDVIKVHYKIYSKAACAPSPVDLHVSEEGLAKFKAAFGKSWQEEVAAGKIMGNPQLMKEKGISASELFLLWSAYFANQQTHKIQDGLLMAYLADLGCYCINGFYPTMAENFYHPETCISYYVVEFDPEQISWEQFRKNFLGATDASQAVPESFRGQLYATYDGALKFPGSDNFVHGSAGPVEGFIERCIHESDFDGHSNPVGQYLSDRGVSIDAFTAWKDALDISQLGELFDKTEEKNTAEALAVLDDLQFQSEALGHF